MSSEEQIGTMKKMRNLARKKARRFISKTDWRPLAEDCEIGGWIGYLEASEKGSSEWICWSEALHSMTDVIVEWIYGVKNYSPRLKFDESRIPFGEINFRLHPSSRPGPEEIVVARNLEQKLRDKLAEQKNGPVLSLVLTDSILEERSRLRRGRSKNESWRVTRGRQVRQIRNLTNQLLK